MKRNEFLQKLGKLRFWQTHGRRAPHKPLLILLALARVAQGQDRLASYKEDIEPLLRDLLKRFGPPRKVIHPEEPFSRLKNDGLWEIRGEKPLPPTKEGGLPRSALIKYAVTGGFPEPIYNLLRSDSGLIQQAARTLLHKHFPYSLHDDIFFTTDFPPEFLAQESPSPRYVLREQRQRDQDFRHNVLHAYECRCAICGFELRLEEELIGLEAAHIKWHSHGGPDKVENGLALCSIHHEALDRGALGLKPTSKGFKILISDKVHGQSNETQWFWDCQGTPLRPPRNSKSRPKAEFVKWHTREVFRVHQ